MDIEARIKQFIQEYFSFIPEEYWTIIALVLGLIVFLANVLNPILTFISHLRNIFRKKRENPAAEGSPREPIRVLRDVWLKDRNPDKPQGVSTEYTNTIIVSVLNMKGGVGKTTFTANFGAAANADGKNVLFVDYDYQGTLTLMLAGATRKTRRDVGANSYMTLFPEPNDEPENVVSMLEPPLAKCGVTGSSYELFRDEMEQFARWSGNQLDYDVRTQLREFLQLDWVQQRFDLVLIDCGPRFTTSTINALCASTHIIVPTKSTLG